MSAFLGKDILGMLRNDDQNYAVFPTAKQHRPGAEQAKCLAGLKPLEQTTRLHSHPEGTGFGQDN